ncbi:exodeoxyribonuclease V subunit beta [Nitrosomonas sp. Nm58]|uniref:UvrD-helicase domain-containing protein n=1 Tax=Nitrosomonas sp. Nm58 TaxID=200126 RepID=UPI000894BB25|nr:UvrD-helicase domain-containing protein [Nitrosomonas sp. Nm58]SDY50180.1 ATP-dependent exoDNAse (exonuclease V) beta subunit (contains helicase and exonuclease domains) [Nitrosomonas sp. Nm58]
MTIRPEVADQAERLRALDPQQSFIVQAPAGSGKTGLLTQRFLILLARVDSPEEIVAITFTRKAASEMRQRILQALTTAQNTSPPQEEYARQTWQLAQRVLAHDQAKGWQLLENPARLRIQTIDSLCAGLVSQMPILSEFGVLPSIAEEASDLYQEAARQTIEVVESEGEWSDAIAHLIAHLDNRLDKLQQLIASMLARRDQWLAYLAGPHHEVLMRDKLEAGLTEWVTDALRTLVDQAPAVNRAEIVALAKFAANQPETGDSVIAHCQTLQDLPGWQITDRPQWEGLATLLLTSKGELRKRVSKNEGFPPASQGSHPEEKAHYREMKQRMEDLLQALVTENEFVQQLALIRTLPPHQYREDEWETLQALFKLLTVAAGYLEVTFLQMGQVDFPALTLAAIQALGEPDAPTDLALALDYRIQHLLVDEFQDTSFNQAELLARLTAGWQPDDGRTLFLVGDPMQSIYRFRQAEVGLFLEIRDHGVFGQIPLEFLRLSVNFRSQQGIIDWINQHFPAILPAKDEIASSAVSYAPSVDFHAATHPEAVTLYPSLQRDDQAEAQQIASIVQQAKMAHSSSTTAILVRNRSHLVQIIAQLKQAGLRFQAVEIERLTHRSIIQDLLALTRALLHHGDRIAWLALLRAPWCGLTLQDLYALAGGDFQKTIIDLLRDSTQLAQLSEDGQQRLARVLPIVESAIIQQAARSLRRNVEGTWIALGGPACVTDETDLDDAEVYFQLLEELTEAGQLPDIQILDERVARLYALPDVMADGSLQLMTIHKAKGLEFDTVILPGLGRTGKHDETKLLYWMKHQLKSGYPALLLAPISAMGDDTNPIMTSLRQLDKSKSYRENGRLLYVAATRAKHRLHLFGHVNHSDAEIMEIKPPPENSLLARLWPVVKAHFQALLNAQVSDKESAENASKELTTQLLPLLPAKRFRLAADWASPPPPEAVKVTIAASRQITEESIEFDWAGETARQVGTVLHRLLQHIGKTGIECFGHQDLFRFEQAGRVLLMQNGVAQTHFDHALMQLSTALKTLWEDERGRWILSGQHADAHCEWALSGMRKEGLDHIVMDRTFVDATGIRWIIDYKTGTHLGSDIEAFLDREQLRYRPQLERYANLMQQREQRPIRLGLYFPMLREWREWPYAIK